MYSDDNNNGHMGAEQGEPEPQFSPQVTPFGSGFYVSDSGLICAYEENILGSGSEYVPRNDIEKEIRKEVDRAVAKAKIIDEIWKEVDEVIAKAKAAEKEIRNEVDESIAKAKGIEKEIRKEVDDAIAKAKGIGKDIRKRLDEAIAKAKMTVQLSLGALTSFPSPTTPMTCDGSIPSSLSHSQVLLKENAHEGIDFSIKFKTSEVFSSRQSIWDWCLKTALKNGFNLVIASNKHISGNSGMASLYLKCDRSGPTKGKLDEKRSKRSKPSKKCGCPFTLNVVEVLLPGQKGTRWITRPNSKAGLHNHVLSNYSSGHRRLLAFTEEEMRHVIEQMKEKVSPANIIKGLHVNDPERAKWAKRKLYNMGHQMRAKEKAGRS